jgi:hypothetical protein
MNRDAIARIRKRVRNCPRLLPCLCAVLVALVLAILDLIQWYGTHHLSTARVLIPIVLAAAAAWKAGEEPVRR